MLPFYLWTIFLYYEKLHHLISTNIIYENMNLKVATRTTLAAKTTIILNKKMLKYFFFFCIINIRWGGTYEIVHNKGNNLFCRRLYITFKNIQLDRNKFNLYPTIYIIIHSSEHKQNTHTVEYHIKLQRQKVQKIPWYEKKRHKKKTMEKRIQKYFLGIVLFFSCTS